MRSLPRYSRMPARACCAPASSAAHQADDFVEYLQQQYPHDDGMLHQYSTQIGLDRLDDTLHTHADQNQKATENVGEGVRDIQDRLGRMEETLKGAEEAASATWDFCDEERRSRAQKVEDMRRDKDEETEAEIKRLTALVQNIGQNENEKTKGLGEAEVRKLLEEREMWLELERLRSKEKGKDHKPDAFINEVQLQHILDEREKADKSRAQQVGSPKEWLERTDLIKILDQRDHEREFARRQQSEQSRIESSIKQEEERTTQEQTFRRIWGEHEQRRELERLKSVEAEALKCRASKTEGSARPSLSEVERLCEDILERHDQRQGLERRRKSVQSDCRRRPSPISSVESRDTIDEILSLLLPHQSRDHATAILETILDQAQSTTAREDNRESDRHWIPTEVLRYFDTLLVDQPRNNHHYEPYPQYHSDGTCTYGHGTTHSTVHPHAHASPPPSYRDTAGTRRWSPDRPHVRFSPGPKAAPAHWERPTPCEQPHRRR